jgi:hypothetical protein
MIFNAVNRAYNGLVLLCNKAYPQEREKGVTTVCGGVVFYTSALKVLCMKIVNILIHLYTKPNDAQYKFQNEMS